MQYFLFILLKQQTNKYVLTIMLCEIPDENPKWQWVMGFCQQLQQ